MGRNVQILNREWIINIANGDQEAFSHFFHALKNKIYSFSYSFIHSAEAAEEITQEVFIKVWRNRESLSQIDNVDAWLSTITKNLCLNYLKKLALERKSKQEFQNGDEPVDQNVEHYLSYKERVLQVAEAVDQLSPQQRLIFTLNRDKGMKNEEIAHQLNLSPNTVKTHLVTALKKIRSFLESHATHLFSLFLLFLKFF
jgi:RNA polymerase sigma-70 factor (family 1)